MRDVEPWPQRHAHARCVALHARHEHACAAEQQRRMIAWDRGCSCAVAAALVASKVALLMAVAPLWGAGSAWAPFVRALDIAELGLLLVPMLAVRPRHRLPRSGGSRCGRGSVALGRQGVWELRAAAATDLLPRAPTLAGWFVLPHACLARLPLHATTA